MLAFGRPRISVGSAAAGCTSKEKYRTRLGTVKLAPRISSGTSVSRWPLRNTTSRWKLATRAYCSGVSAVAVATSAARVITERIMIGGHELGGAAAPYFAVL